MPSGAGITDLTVLRPVNSVPIVNGSNAVGATYGSGVGRARLYAVTYSVWDSAEVTSMEGLGFTFRLVVINGYYAFPAATVLPNELTLASSADVRYDVAIQDPGPKALELWFSPLVSDKGAPITVIASALFFGSGGLPIGAAPVTTLNLHADYAIRPGGPTIRESE